MNELSLWYILFGTSTRVRIFVYTLLYVVIGMSIFPALKRKWGMGVVASRKYFHSACFILFAPSCIFCVSPCHIRARPI